jgi:acyl-CoA thioesterase
VSDAEPSGDFLDLIGLEPREEGGERIYEIEVTPQLMNPYGVLHGGVVYSLADTSMGGVLSPELAPNERTATIEITIHYLRPVRAGKIRVDTKVVQKGRRVATLESDVYNADGGDEQLVAKALGSFAIFEIR